MEIEISLPLGLAILAFGVLSFVPYFLLSKKKPAPREQVQSKKNDNNEADF
jgi:hypothetical protein